MQQVEEFKNINGLYDKLKQAFNNSFDINIEKIKTTEDTALLIYIEGLTDKDLMDRDIITPIKTLDFEGNIGNAIKTTYKDAEDFNDLITKIVEGSVALCYNGYALIIDFRKWTTRSVESPEAENVTRGPREGFNEDLVTNTSLLRRKIRNAGLIFEKYKIGRQSNTAVVIAYIGGVVNEDILAKVRKRLGEIDIDIILESGSIEQYIERNPFSTVSGIGLTQKPDIVAARILEGRVAIICDGTPHVLTIPELFIENIHSSEDYYHRTFFASFLRALRMIALFISILLPGLSVSIINFNAEMLPSTFLISLVALSEKTPFPEAVEIFFLILMLELLKESGTRLPKTIGSAVSIVGALIIGEAAVRAGLVGAPTVIIVALTAVTSFIIPSLNEFTTIYRLVFLALGASFGIIGIGAGIAFMLAQLSSINSFGVPIMSFFSKRELKDSMIRFPLKQLKYRPQNIAKNNIKRAN
ncbi:MAG: spore germination protein [Clostridia bacterium]|nr:spore germination protein [Clostridia bacterium]